MAAVEEAAQPDINQIQLDPVKVIGSLQRQIAEQAGQIAQRDALLEMQAAEIAEMRTLRDQVQAQVKSRTTVEHNGRTTKKKGK